MGAPMGSPMSPSFMGNEGIRQYILETAQGFPGSGIATIAGEQQLFVVAHMPPPSSAVQNPSACYVVYLVDKKGQQGFAAGTMTAGQDGACQFSFQSPVPLSYFTRVIISVEDSRNIQAYPQGPIVLKVKDDIRSRLKQGNFANGAFGKAGNMAKKAGGFVQKKAGGLFSRFSKNPAPIEGMAAATAMPQVSSDLAAGGMGAALGTTIGAAVAQNAINPGIPPNQLPLDPPTQINTQNPLPHTVYPQDPYAQTYTHNSSQQTYVESPQTVYQQNPRTQSVYPQSLNSQASYQLNTNPQGQSQQQSYAQNPYQQGSPSPNQITANKLFPSRTPNSNGL